MYIRHERGKVGTMQVFLISGLLFCGFISLILSLVLLKAAATIDGLPLAEGEVRDRGIGSPVEFTRLSVKLFWPLFFCGGWMVFQHQSRILFIAGIAMLAGLVLFLITAVVFSMAVLNQIGSGRNEKKVSSPGTKSGKRRSRLFSVLRIQKDGESPRVR